MTDPHLILAQVNRGGRGLQEALNNFFASPLGQIAGYVLDLVALGLVAYGVLQILKALKSNNPGAEILKKGTWPFLGVALVLQLNWTTSVNTIFGKIIKALFDSVTLLIPGL